MANVKPGHILIIEDDEDILEVLKLMLEDEGHRVVAARGGAEALAAAASEKPFDLVVLDISMPDMNGIEVAQKLRMAGKTAGIRIAIHTALEERWVKDRFADYDLFFGKARDVEVLVKGIARLLAEPKRTQAGTASPGPSFTVEQTMRAKSALRATLGVGADALSSRSFFALLADEIDQLRKLGHDDPAIAALIATAVGFEVAPSLIATHAASAAPAAPTPKP